jgi:hypothetical protein
MTAHCQPSNRIAPNGQPSNRISPHHWPSTRPPRPEFPAVLPHQPPSNGTAPHRRLSNRITSQRPNPPQHAELPVVESHRPESPDDSVPVSSLQHLDLFCVPFVLEDFLFLLHFFLFPISFS